MTQDELIQRILILVPNAKLSIWSPSGDYYGDQDPIHLGGYRVCWSPLNTDICPSEEEISNITQEQVDQFVQNQNDSNLYNQYKDDVSMKALYGFQKKSSPDLSFIDFLKSIQNTEV